ncbi:uncharacterized protein LOC129320705 isoform X2 [Prosopis cineraria]|uniref:uncharacterized protein LOC129320705 isoform X2 n=1 Tax=Prosopis cineraria TaxID=364024 RepID=UPI00240EE1C6|nr:uncharacterized protein LOC129320705 isoform X2 [Prosopis cineraria]
MGSGDNFSDGIAETRTALADCTNRPQKRAFSSISVDPAPESGHGCCKIDNIGGDLHFSKKACIEGRHAAGDSQELANHDSANEERDRSLPKLASSKCGATECSKISGSLDSKFPGLERCVGLKGGGSEKSTEDEDPLKACSCFFCSTAAYMWSDLHYQDIKGRLSALKKSQKEAAKLVQKISGAKDNAVYSQRTSADSSKLELDLMDQWRSLFGHMENTLADESRQLESSFEKLKDLRESFKNDQEVIDKRRSQSR